MHTTIPAKPGSRRAYRQAIKNMILLWANPIAAGLLAFLVYGTIAEIAASPFSLSDAPYFNYLADAFLHGQLHLRLIPPSTIDLSLFQGRYYLYWGPLPALFAMPLVALFGVTVSDVLQTLVVSGLVVGVCAAILHAANRRGVIHLNRMQIALLVIFFAFGTAYFPITETGHVWMLLQVWSILFGLLAYWTAFTQDGLKAFFLTGLMMAGVVASRMSAIFAAIFLVWYLYRRHWQLGAKKLVGYSLLGLLPVLVVSVLILLYNQARFGSPFDNGLDYHLYSEFFREDFLTYGVFDLVYVAENFYYTYLYYPYSLNPIDFKIKCGSLFLMSPLFFALLYALWQDRRWIGTWMLFLSIILGNIPLLLLMGPGSGLVGPRYTLDFIMPLLLLTALGMRRWPNRVVVALILISMIQYGIGGMIYILAIV